MIAIIDYDAGNIKSVAKACAYLGYEAAVTDNEKAILSADRVILPGVGAFGDAMRRLKERGLISVLRRVKEERVPLLGICLGLQLLFDGSEESSGIPGLGLLAGDILRIPEKNEDPEMSDGYGMAGGIRHLRVPHIGWNDLTLQGNGRLFSDLPANPYVYFVHSYYLKAKDRQMVKATTEYGVTIDASVEADRIFACQFHPEKSGKVGLSILQSFLGGDF